MKIIIGNSKILVNYQNTDEFSTNNIFDDIKNVRFEEKNGLLKVYHKKILKVVEKTEGSFINNTEITTENFFEVMKVIIYNTDSGAIEQQPIANSVRIRYIMPAIKGLKEPVYKTEYYAKGASVAAYPPLPEITDNRLEFDGYTHTLQELSDLQNDIDVGVLLKTVDGKTYADFTLTPVTGLSPTIYFQISGTATFRVNWGDGCTNDYYLTETPTHTYPDYGDYSLSIERISGNGTISLGGGTSLKQFFSGSVKCHQLTSFYAGSFTAINSYALHCSYHLSSVVIPRGVTSIGSYAFQQCNSLSSVVIPSVTSISDYMLAACISLSSVVISSGVTSIGDYAFQSCRHISSIVIPDGVTSIGAYAFQYCLSLTSFAIPNSVTSIGAYAFQYCVSLTSIVIPDGVTSIGAYAFRYCYNLSSVVIPGSLTSIGNYVFNLCYKLSSVVLSNGIKSIGNYMFSECYSLASIVIPNGVTSIGDKSFYNCMTLSSVIIPDSVTSIGENSFDLCPLVKSYEFLREIPPSIRQETFIYISAMTKMYVPNASVQAYKSATNWTAYTNHIYPLSQKPE